MDPPPGTEQLLDTYIFEGAIWELAIPLVLNLGDLSGVLVVEDVDSAGDGLLLGDTLGNIASLQVHANRIASTDDFVVKTLDLGKGCLKTILPGVREHSTEKTNDIPIGARIASGQWLW